MAGTSVVTSHIKIDYSATNEFCARRTVDVHPLLVILSRIEGEGGKINEDRGLFDRHACYIRSEVGQLFEESFHATQRILVLDSPNFHEIVCCRGLVVCR